MMIFVRTTGDPSAVAGTVREAIRRVAPTMPVYDVRPMSTRVSAARGQAQFRAVVLGLFAAVALTLAVMGIYGVMSFAVAQRTQEIGVRMALGAARRSVLLLIMRDTAWLAGSGLAIGVVAALAFGRLLRSMLFEVSPGRSDHVRGHRPDPGGDRPARRMDSSLAGRPRQPGGGTSGRLTRGHRGSRGGGRSSIIAQARHTRPSPGPAPRPPCDFEHCSPCLSAFLPWFGRRTHLPVWSGW